MIFENHECFFAGIPKNGTHTVYGIVNGIEAREDVSKKANHGRMSDNERCLYAPEARYDFYQHGHMTNKQWIKIKKRIKKYKNYTTFSVIRNPYDRAVSIFRHYCDQHALKNVNLKSFHNWLRDKEPVFIDKWGTQTEFLINESGVIDIDCLAKLDSLHIGWESYREINPKWPFFKHGVAFNKQPPVYSRQFYNSQTEELVYRIYQKDFELLGYERL